MGSSLSVQPKVEEKEKEQEKVSEEPLVFQESLVPPEPTSRAYTGEGAFTYKPNAVLDNITISATFIDVTPEKSATHLVSKKNKEHLKDECYFFAQYGECDTEDCPYIHIRKGVMVPEDAPEDEEYEEEEEVPLRRKRPKRRAKAKTPQKRRKSSRIAAQNKKPRN